ncbi:Nicotinate-nucleotide--dimethylbenzimidazole phosphoribosyltransferase [Tepidanaerobacter acetatoxydans Re1]|uniref:Nicotinate-nucleotide--dimethylbenzimidazole phosphoribosyltransferase n=2 Tax=Tepidanaerobacter acetatoxydans TaxID=499229 RepID=F4LSG4_TEPAE|nr:nicotinate-nucleotide--dimethylbenzimidazole phosphoribosyltransferase [Tepidanaerobacter acetatoxydans]AEE91230.1 Nicotinate-nucleotide--dimethylbenzimidazole phosphoribosyltransferase [Tepidanaerobacter acetatoxydans Re1]CCP25908.1 Nicotinate-nucleotide--dimethylbenzimidazole phosphoribosyltransferase [Tepidanaerobacter acetatoxydans Re1]
MTKLEQTLQQIKPLDEEVMEKTQARLDDLTKPVGSLGMLENIAKQIAGITGSVVPELPKKAAILMAGDHGIVKEGVAPFPQEVTPQMVLNFVNGGAAMSVLARHENAKLYVVDIGVASDLPDVPNIIKRKVAYGTKNMAEGPAMTYEEATQAVEVGIDIAEMVIREGAGIIAIGEMGIGNTSPSSAIIATYSNLPVKNVVGRGTGVDDEKLKIKIAAIEKALTVNKPNPKNPLDVLSKVGGFEIAGLTGVILACAANRVPVIIDGFISGAAAVIAKEMSPLAVNYMLGSHLSEEPGHKIILDFLGIKPILMMNMRLGEGTGAALAMNVIDASLKILKEMSTFSEAGVSNKL